MENDYSEWADNPDNMDKYLISGRISYLNNLGNLNKYLQLELEDAKNKLQEINDREKALADNEEKVRQFYKKQDEDKKALLKQKEEEDKAKWLANKDLEPKLDENIIELWNDIEEQLYSKNQLILSILINRFNDLNDTISAVGISKISCKDYDSISDNDFYNLILTTIKTNTETNHKKYIRYKKSNILYSNFLLEKIEKIKEIRQISLDKNNIIKRQKENILLLKKKFCECCEKEISTRNWALHIRTKVHLAKA